MDSPEVVTLPLDPAQMLEFLENVIHEGKALETAPLKIIEQAHDYACYWLHAIDNNEQEAPANTRMN